MKKVVVFFLFIFSLLNAQHRPKIGLVLSGGGAKGYAHIGVLEELEKLNIPIDYIGGTSMGAIVGGLYASGYNATELNRILHETDFEKMIYNEKTRENTPLFQKQYEEKYLISLEFNHFKLKIPKAFSKGQGAINTLTKYLQHVHHTSRFSKLPIPFLCVATNLETGKEKIFRKGYLPQTIMASAAYPTLFAPVKIDSSYYIDGGLTNNFPVQEVRDMGADIIIGVDLGEGLLKENQINSPASLLGQIVSYGINKKTNEQRKKVDILIKPNVKGFTVTSFQDKDTLIERGKKAVLNNKKSLDSISILTRKHSIKRKNPFINTIYLLEDVKVKGLKNYTINYVLGKLGFTLPQAINYDMILQGIDALYATGNFNHISHRLEENKDGAYTLYLDVAENKNKLYVKAGLHYDELFKSSLLFNFTAKNVLGKNSTLSMDFIFGDKPRYYFNYFVDNGIIPSVGINSSFKQFYFRNNLKATDQSLIYGVKNFQNQFYLQSTLKEKYALGLGLEHEYIKIETQNLPKENPKRFLQNGSFLIPYTYLKIDSRDNRFFAKKGFNVDVRLDYIAQSSAEKNFKPMYLLKYKGESNITINRFLTFKLGTRFNTAFNQTPPNGLGFYLGGMQRQQVLNTIPFYGLDFAQYPVGSLLSISPSFQIKTFKNQYLTLSADLMSAAENFKQIDFLAINYKGYGISYGYDSPFGPLLWSLSYSPNYRKFIPYFSLGFWF